MILMRMSATATLRDFKPVLDLFYTPYSEFEFMQRALVGVIAIALGGGPIGVFLMLRRMSLTGDAMAHAILPGAAVGYLLAGLSLPAMTVGGLAAGVIVAVAAGLVSRFTSLKEDASLAAFYLLSLALGVTIVSLRGSNVDLLHVLFGTVLALDDNTLLLLASISTITVLALAVLYRPLVLECVDPIFLRSVSRAGTPTHLIFLGLVVMNLVGGFHALGTLLAVGMMMLPAAAARFWTSDITMMMIVSILIGIISGISGLLLSFHAELPAGPAIILSAGAIYVASLLLGRTGGVLWLAWPGKHLEA
jgi:zinc/manganese transport system permease protein